MQIHINTDNHIEGSDRRENYFNTVLQEKLSRFEDRITSLEIHLSDENASDKKGVDDKKCTIEARVNGIQPLVASHHADSVEKAITGAADKIKKVLEHTFDKMKSH